MKNNTEDYKIVSTSEDGYSIVKKDQKYGLIDINGSVVIPPEYQEICEFKGGKAKAKKKWSWGFIDMKGNTVIPFDYREIGEFNGGKAIAKKNNIGGLIGYIDENGIELTENEIELPNGLIIGEKFKKFGVRLKDNTTIIPYEYNEIGEFIEGKAKAKRGDSYGYIDESGSIIIPFKYSKIEKFVNGRAKATEIRSYNSDNNRCGVIDENGDTIIPFIYYEIGEFANGKAKASIYHVFEYRDRDNSYEMFGYLDEKGNIIIPFKYEDIGDFINGKAKVRKSWNKWGYIRENGQIIIPAVYENIGEFINGKAKTIKDGKYGYMDDNGNVLIANEFDQIEDFVDGKAKASRKRIWGLIDELGNEITYDETELNNGLIIGCKFGKWGVKSKDNVTIIPYEYDVFDKFIDGKAKVKKSDGNWGYIDEKGIELVNNETELPNGLLKGDKFGKWGLRTKNYAILFPYEYDMIGEFIDGKAKAKRNGKYGFINDKGSVIIPFEYYEIEEFINGKAKANRSSWKEWGLIDENGSHIIENEIELSNGLIIGQKFGKWGIETKDKTTIVPFEYDFIGKNFVNGKTIAFKEGNCGIIDDKGNILIPFEYSNIMRFNNGIARATKRYNYDYIYNSEGDEFEKYDTSYGYIDESGNIIIPFEYEFIDQFNNGKARAKKGKKNWGVIDEQNNIIIPFEYRGIGKFINGKAKVTFNGHRFGYVDDSGNIVIPINYARIGRFINSKAIACLYDNGKMKYGCIDETGNIIIPFEYEELSYFKDGKAIAQKKWDFIIIDEENNEIKINDSIQIPFEYLTKEQSIDGTFEYKKNSYIVEVNISVGEKWECYIVEDGERELTNNLFNKKGISLGKLGSQELEVRIMDIYDSDYLGNSGENNSYSNNMRDSFNELTQGTYGDYDKWREGGGDLTTLNAELGY